MYLDGIFVQIDVKINEGCNCHNLISVGFKHLLLFIHEVKMLKLSYFESTKSLFSGNILR
jgi:hypothetical protein